MPTMRILADDEAYYMLGLPERRAIARQIHLEGGGVLHRDIKEALDGIEVLWLAPFEKASAVNTYAYAVDIEFSAVASRETIGRLAYAVLQAFRDTKQIPLGTKYGVWIKTPYGFFWFEDEKKQESDE